MANFKGMPNEALNLRIKRLEQVVKELSRELEGRTENQRPDVLEYLKKAQGSLRSAWECL